MARMTALVRTKAMGDVISFSKARKAMDKRAKERKAAQNRALHGRTGAAKKSEAEEARRLRDTVDGARLNDPDKD